MAEIEEISNNSDNLNENLDNVSDNVPNEPTSGAIPIDNQAPSDMISALGTLKLTLNYDNFEGKVSVISSKIYYENNDSKSLKVYENELFKNVVEGQDALEKFFFDKFEDTQSCKLLGKLRPNNQFIIRTFGNGHGKGDMIDITINFKNGIFTALFQNIKICKSDFYAFIKDLDQKIKKYYKVKKHKNVCVYPPDVLIFDLKAYYSSQYMQ